VVPREWLYQVAVCVGSSGFGRYQNLGRKKFDWHSCGFLLFNPHMGSIKKRRKAKINKHKRRKKLRLNRHKKRTWQK
jgi:hypothetical protein